LFSRVMRDGLSTGIGTKSPGSCLSGPIFSGPHDCVDLVKSFQAIGISKFFRGRCWTLRRRWHSPRWNGDRTASPNRHCPPRPGRTASGEAGVRR